MMDTTRTLEIVLYMVISLTERLSNTVTYYCGMTTDVLNNKRMSFVHSVFKKRGSTVLEHDFLGCGYICICVEQVVLIHTCFCFNEKCSLNYPNVENPNASII